MSASLRPLTKSDPPGGTFERLVTLVVAPADPDAGVIWPANDKLLRVQVNGKWYVVSEQRPCILGIDPSGVMTIWTPKAGTVMFAKRRGA